MRVWALLFGVTALLSAGIQFPLSLAIKLSGVPIQADRMTGTVWSGRLEGASLEGYPIGNVEMGAAFLPLLTGQLSARVDVDGPIARGKALISARPGRVRLNDAEALIWIAPLQLKDAFGAPMAGVVDITANDLVIADGACQAGQVSLSTDAYERSAVRYGGEGFPLSGDGVCEEGVFLLPLSGAGAEGSVEASIRVSKAGYQTELLVEPTDPQFGSLLAAYGFQQRGTQYSLIQRGEVF